MTFDDKCVWEWLWEPSPRNELLRQVAVVPRFSPLVMQELDCGNCVLGEGDPVYWLDRYPLRNPVVHVMPAIEGTGTRPGECGVGSKSDRADWPRIIGALKRNGVEWLVVKPTLFPGSLADLQASAEYLRGLGVGWKGLADAGGLPHREAIQSVPPRSLPDRGRDFEMKR
jgi:hypothetical protein